MHSMSYEPTHIGAHRISNFCWSVVACTQEAETELCEIQGKPGLHKEFWEEGVASYSETIFFFKVNLVYIALACPQNKRGKLKFRETCF